ncbi:hypothetical protein MIMGU_mgv1a027109mg [Erythranthe guttata]|uniref:NB-ARC domain-containing protein n=1 Tax=Erythranthe guttata TaxID=4155 RepID=A0A022RPU3_ERYGU|nr:hypothetical protein MIMGU_mgv1a027109mg [Erythranthe guttata]
MIQSFLIDAENKQITNGTVKLWLHKLEGVAFDADNVLDELDYQHLSETIHHHTQHKIKKKVRFFFPRNIRRLKMAHKIEDINKNLKEINKEASNYGLQNIVAGADGSQGPSVGRETDSFGNDPIFLGRENDVSEIVKMMTTPPNGDHVFSILPIVGMGGLGKSTVAREVFHHETIKTHFANRFWVHVSENFDVVILFKKILTSLTGKNIELGNKQALLEKLQKKLGTERFLLVLDDVWNENRKKWDDFINSLRNISCTTGNGIMVTTRLENVASLVATLGIHKLKDLSKDACWSIVKAKAFPRSNVGSEFNAIGVSIAKRCQGLPLAANVVGGFLRGKSIDEWLSIEKNWLSDLGDENLVSNILKLSFNHLSSPSLKRCFAYCSIFPKGFDLEKEQLVGLWMAEGFLGGNDDMESMGGKFFNLLLQNSLLQFGRSVRGLYTDITYYNMHDLVHDLASSILNSRINDQVRYMGLQSISVESSDIPNEQARCLRSLLFNGEICARMFSEFKSLHVLILMSDGGEELPSTIKELIHLRCLDISRTRIKCLPDSVGELYHLQTLRVCNLLEKLPTTTRHLAGLRHLHIPRIELPPEMARLTSLRTLPYFGVGDEKGCGIGELRSLKNLVGELEIYNLEKVQSKEEATSADLLHKPTIFKLKLTWDEDRKGENNDEIVLEGLQPHPDLKSLKIYGFRGRRFPPWYCNISGLNKLMEIKLESCTECEQLPTLGHLPHLKNLYLHNLANVKSIGSSFYGVDDNCGSTSSIGVSKSTLFNVFPALERLELRGMSELREWLEVELPNGAENQLPVVFPCLEYLMVDSCTKLKSAPSHFPCLQELEIYGMDSGLPLASICGMTLISEIHEESCSKLGELPDDVRHLSALEVLIIDDCPNMRELPYDLHSLSALEILRLESCPNLKAIPYPHESHDRQLLLGLSCLRELSVISCEGLVDLEREMMESCELSLEDLHLRGLGSLRMDMGTMIGYCLHKMPCLSRLSIVGVPTATLVINSSSEIGLPLGFRILDVTTTCDQSDSDWTDIVDAVLKASTKSLRKLTLRGTERSRDLPDSLQHLTALSRLWLTGFGEMEALSDWLGNNNNLSSSLQRLLISHCRNFCRLPSKEAMQRLTKLTELGIYYCPLLNLKRRRDGDDDNDDDDDSEWPKISHIPKVEVVS